MSDAPVSPTAKRLASPSWLDTRLVLGVLLVLVSVVVGASILSSADNTTVVYVAARDLEPGATLQDGDYRAVQVRLERTEVDRLVGPGPDGTAPDGQVALQPLREGDLVLRSDLVDERGTEIRQFTLNVENGHMPPDLTHSELVDVYVTPGRDAAAAPASAAPQAPGTATGQARLVLPGVVVADVGGAEEFGGGEAVPVVLNLSPGQVITMVRAVAEGQIDLVRQLGRTDPDPVPTRAGVAEQAQDGSPAPSPSPTAG